MFIFFTSSPPTDANKAPSKPIMPNYDCDSESDLEALSHLIKHETQESSHSTAPNTAANTGSFPRKSAKSFGAATVGSLLLFLCVLGTYLVAPTSDMSDSTNVEILSDYVNSVEASETFAPSGLGIRKSGDGKRYKGLPAPSGMRARVARPSQELGATSNQAATAPSVPTVEQLDDSWRKLVHSVDVSRLSLAGLACLREKITKKRYVQVSPMKRREIPSDSGFYITSSFYSSPFFANSEFAGFFNEAVRLWTQWTRNNNRGLHPKVIEEQVNYSILKNLATNLRKLSLHAWVENKGVVDQFDIYESILDVVVSSWDFRFMDISTIDSFLKMHENSPEGLERFRGQINWLLVKEFVVEIGEGILEHGERYRNYVNFEQRG